MLPDRNRRIIEPYGDELEKAAAQTDNPADADIFAGLAAIARGEDVPRDVAHRVVERAREV